MHIRLFHWILSGPIIVALTGVALTSRVAAYPADVPGPTNGDTSGPEAVFKKHELIKLGKLLVSSYEADVHADANAVRGLRSKVVSESLARAALSRSIDTAEKVVRSLDARLLAIDAQMKQVKDNPDKFNVLVDPYNSTLKEEKMKFGQLEELRKKQGSVGDSQAAWSDAAVRGAYLAALLTASYAYLPKDAELSAAIKKFNEGSAQPVKLGPSGAFVADAAFLKKCVDDMTAEGIPVHMDGGVPVVEVIINDKRHDMIWDSGATAVSLSAETAEELGLRVTDQDQTVEATLADGSKVKNKLITAPLIRVGPFSVENVVCVVAAPGAVRPPDLLGGTFQSHFLCRLDQQAGVLHLTPLNAPKHAEPSAPISAPAATAPDSQMKEPLRIDSAVYGNGDRTIDLTNALRHNAKADPFLCVGADKSLGDPADELTETLTLRYVSQGKSGEIQLSEGDAASVPVVPQQGVALNGVDPGFLIVAARWGVGIKWRDVTDLVRQQVKVPTQPSKFIYSAPDIASGMHKHLVVWFNNGGRRFCRILRDDQLASYTLVDSK